MPDRNGVLEAAREAVASRGQNYGTPEQNFDRISDLWDAYLSGRARGRDACITAADVAAMMILVKVGRLMQTPDHLDSWVDIAGYAACGGEITSG